jgi:hypothetical protein
MIQKPVLLPFRSSFLPALFILCLIHSAFASDWQLPYEKGSASDSTLSFGYDGLIDASLPQLFDGLSHTILSTKATFGTWNLQTSGAVTSGRYVYPFMAAVGTGQAQIQIIDNTLKFNLITDGVSELSGATPSMSWRASSLILESTEWIAPGAIYAYQFDFNLNSILLDAYPELFDSIKLTIVLGEETAVYNQSLKELLGIEILTNPSSRVTVPFDYNPSDGPIEILWKADMNLIDSHFLMLGDGTSSIFEISNSFIFFDAIPEPPPSVLMTGGAVGLYILSYRRRKRTTTDHPSSIARNSASVMTRTPSFPAFSSLLPASSPARR